LQQCFGARGQIGTDDTQNTQQQLLSIDIGLGKDQNQESKQLSYELYSAGLTTEQIGGLMDKVYGHHYSK
jgi:hypothetical protein